MSKYILKIVDDLSKFQDMVPVISSSTSEQDVKRCINDLKETLNANKDLVALCAPQIGQNLRLFCVKTADKKIKAFLNPIIVKAEGLHLSREVNASIKGKEFIIPRKDKIHLAYQEPNGVPTSESYTGAYSEVIQQMIEMLDGIVLSDYGLEIESDFDKATDEEKTEILQLYLNSLKNESKELSDEIENTPNLKQINDTIEFVKGMLLGDIKPIDKDGNIVETGVK